MNFILEVEIFEFIGKEIFVYLKIENRDYKYGIVIWCM